MGKKITFCVIMPCYNSEAYLSNAIESLQNSVYPYWKLIAVNDGSNDRTLELLNDYANRDKRILVYSKDNGGYCSAINYGLDRVLGDYFLMMGSDDQLGSTLFAEIVDCIGDKLPDLIGFRTTRVIDGKNAGIDRYTDFSSIAYEFDSTIKTFETNYPKHAQIFFTRDTSKCYKTALLGELRYFGKYGIDADGIFSMLFAHKARSFMSVPVDGYYWTLRSNSLSANRTIAMDFDRLNNWIEFIEAISYLNTSEITKQEISYLELPQKIGIEILDTLEKLDKNSFICICNARRASVSEIRKIYDKYYMYSLRGVVYIYLPRIWYFLHRKKIERRKKRNII